MNQLDPTVYRPVSLYRCARCGHVRQALRKGECSDFGWCWASQRPADARRRPARGNIDNHYVRR